MLIFCKKCGNLCVYSNSKLYVSCRKLEHNDQYSIDQRLLFSKRDGQMVFEQKRQTWLESENISYRINDKQIRIEDNEIKYYNV